MLDLVWQGLRHIDFTSDADAGRIESALCVKFLEFAEQTFSWHFSPNVCK